MSKDVNLCMHNHRVGPSRNCFYCLDTKKWRHLWTPPFSGDDFFLWIVVKIVIQYFLKNSATKKKEQGYVQSWACTLDIFMTFFGIFSRAHFRAIQIIRHFIGAEGCRYKVLAGLFLLFKCFWKQAVMF